MMSQQPTTMEDFITDRIAGGDPSAPPTQREVIRDLYNSPFGLLQQYREPKVDPLYKGDIWKQIDARGAEADLSPDPYQNQFTASPQQTGVTRQSGEVPDAIAKMLVPTTPTEALTMFWLGGPAGKIATRSLAGAGALMGELMDPAEAASLKAIKTSTSVFDHLKPGDTNFWHRIASRKLDRPLADIPFAETGRAPPMSSVVDPSTIEGKFMMPLPGDPTKRGKAITSVDNIPLSEPFVTQGGRGYIDDVGGFANAPGAATAAAKRTREYQDKFGNDVLGVYTKMGAQSGDFSSHTWGLLSRMFENAPMSKTAKADMDAAIRSEIKKAPRTKEMIEAGENYPMFPGVEAPYLEQYLRHSPDVYRKAFVNATEKARGEIKGVPDVVAARYAATEPGLLFTPTNSAGQTMTKLTGETRPSKHFDYPVHVEGEGSFGLGMNVPREVMYPDMMRHFDKTQPDPAFWLRKMQMPPSEIPYGQLATPKWVDATSDYIANVKQMGETAALDRYMKQHFPTWK